MQLGSKSGYYIHLHKFKWNKWGKGLVLLDTSSPKLKYLEKGLVSPSNYKTLRNGPCSFSSFNSKGVPILLIRMEQVWERDIDP